MYGNISKMEAEIATFAYRYNFLLEEKKVSIGQHAATLGISTDYVAALRQGKAMPAPALVDAIAADLHLIEGFLEGVSPFAQWSVESHWLQDAMDYAGFSLPRLAERVGGGMGWLFAYLTGVRHIPPHDLGKLSEATGYPIDTVIFVFLQPSASEQLIKKLKEDLKEAKPLSEAAMQLIDQIVQLDRDGSFDARTVAAFNCQVELARKYPFVPSHCS